MLSEKWADEFAQKMMENNLSDDMMEQEFDSLFRSGLNRFSYNPLDELANEYEFSRVSLYHIWL
jgi:hypothetical protein